MKKAAVYTASVTVLVVLLLATTAPVTADRDRPSHPATHRANATVVFPSPDHYRGVEIAPIGGVLLPPPAPNLLIQNISDIPGDGVSFTLGAAQGFSFELVDAPEPPSGDTTIVTVGALTTQSDPLSLSAAIDEFDIFLLPDFSGIGGSDFQVEVWNNGAPVSVFPTTTAPAQVDRSSGDISTIELDTHGVKHPLPSMHEIGHTWVVRLQAQALITVGNPPTVVAGEEVRFYHSVADNSPDPISQVDVTFEVPVSIAPAEAEIGSIGVKQFGNYHAGTGAAVISAGDPLMPGPQDIAEDIIVTFAEGDTGGVSIREAISEANAAPPSADAPGCDIWQIKGNEVGPGGEDTYAVLGTLMSAPDDELFVIVLSSAQNGAQWTVTPDFSALGAPSVDLKLYDDTGALVLDAPGFTGSYTIDGSEYASELGGNAHNGLSLVQAFATNQTITVPPFAAVSASKCVMTIPFPATLNRITGRFRQLSNAPAVELHLKVETREFTVPGLGNIHVSPTPNAYIERGYDYTAYFPNPEAVGTQGGSFLQEADVDAYLRNQLAVQWLSLEAPTTVGDRLDIDLFVENETSPTLRQAGLDLVSNGAGVDLFVDPGTSGVTSADVTVRNEAGLVESQFTVTDFGLSVFSSTEWPAGAATNFRVDGQYSVSALSMAPVVVASAPYPLPPGKKDVEVKFKQPEIPKGPKKTEIGSDPLGPMIFTDLAPVPVGVQSTPQAHLALHPAFPNPFNPTVTIRFDVPGGTKDVTIAIYDVTGRRIRTLMSGDNTPGFRSVKWFGENEAGEQVASGVYFVSMRSGSFHQSRKLVLLK